MNNYEEKIFLYLKGKMSSEQRILFEDELKKSEVLSNDFKDYKNFVFSINETKNIDLNKDYLESIVPYFRSRLERKDKKKSFKKLKYVFASLLIIVTGYFVISNYNKDNKQELNQTLADLSNDEINLIANDFYVVEDLSLSMDDVSAQKIYSIYAEDLKTSLVESIGDANSNVVLSKFNITDVDQYLSDADIEIIYSQLIDKKIL